MHPPNYLAGLGLFLSIGGIAFGPTSPMFPAGVTSPTPSPIPSPVVETSPQPSPVAPQVSPSPSPAVASPSPNPQGLEKQTFLWGYKFDSKLVPDLSYLTLKPGVTYRLFDKNHKCIGLLTPQGDNHETKLIHRYPTICEGGNQS